MSRPSSPQDGRPVSGSGSRPTSHRSKRPGSASPSRLRRDVNSFQESEDPILRSATRKIADACNRFDRARDGMFLKVY